MAGAQSGQDWRRIGPTRALAGWAAAAWPLAQAALAPAPRRAGGTWAVGLDLLPNDAAGAVGGVALPWGDLGLSPVALHRAQLSAVYPGYPRADPGEAAQVNRYRLMRDAAHLDGVIAAGPDNRRRVQEPHAWILGVALTDSAASPLVVWQGSAAVMQAALRTALAGHPATRWGEVDVTEAYVAARRRVFDTCARIDLPVRRGEATLLHRLCLHGVAPWGVAQDATGPGRVIAYFRPQLASVEDWLA